MATLRAADYRRISDDAEGLEHGVERQGKDNLARCAKEGWTHVATFKDNDIGASTRSKKRRPDFEEMMERAEQREFDVIVAYSNSRFTRRPAELERLIQLHERTGIRLVTIVSGDDDLSTADGRMVARIKASVDAAEAERTGERVTRAFDDLARKGKPKGGSRPFGFAEDQITHNPSEAAALREVADRILQGESVTSMARLLDARGLRPVRAVAWSATALRAVLTGPRIAGLRQHHNEIVGDAVWEPILDRETYAQLKTLFTSPERRTSPGGSTRSFLASGGISICGVCSVKLEGTQLAGGRRLYRCPRKGQGGCGSVARTADYIDQMLSAWAVVRLREWRADDVEATDEVVKSLLAAAARHEASIKNAEQAHDEELLEDFDYFRLLKKHREEIRKARAEIARIRGQRTLSEAAGEDAACTWEAASLVQKRLLLRELKAQVVIWPVKRRGPKFEYETVEIHSLPE